jgi:hypothetical protein
LDGPWQVLRVKNSLLFFAIWEKMIHDHAVYVQVHRHCTSTYFTFDSMPLTREFSFTALDNPDYALPVPTSISCHSQTQTTVAKPFVKPPTMPLDRISFIHQSSPLGTRPSSHNFPTLSVLPPPKQLAPLKPKLNLYRKTLIFYWAKQSLAHQKFLKKRVIQVRVSKKHTPKKCVKIL